MREICEDREGESAGRGKKQKETRGTQVVLGMGQGHSATCSCL